ncbi:MAG TPA: DUF748 domain-containing protein [Candidatus Polarisedimenticolia bacterium]|nr:DUF748 domain-containing protein [Candidatus Polarisedimenticolia bacterium]
MPWFSHRHASSSLTRWLLYSSLALAVYAVAGFLAAPYFARPYLTRTLSTLLHRDVSLQRLRINPFALSATADGFLVKDPDGSIFIGWDRLYVNFQLVSLVSDAWSFRQIQLTNFTGHLVMRKDGSLNVSDIIDSLSQQPATSQPPSEPPLFRVGRLRIEDARMDFLDRSRPAEFRTQLGPLRIDLREFGTSRDNKNPYAFYGKTESGESFSWKGYFYLDPIRSKGEFTIGNFLLGKYHPYYSDSVAFDIKGGTADFASAYELEWGPARRVARLEGADLKIKDLKISERGLEELAVDVPTVEMSGGVVDGLTGRARVALLDTSGGSLIIRQYPDRTNNLRRMLAPLLEGETEVLPAAERAAAKPAPPPAPAGTADSAEPQYRIEEVRFRDYKVLAEDQVPKRPVQVHFDRVNMDMHNVDNRLETTSNGTLSLRWEQGGTVSLAGDLAILKLQCKLKAKMDGIDITPLDPYLEPTADLRVRSGKLTVDGEVQASLLDPAHPTFAYVGSVVLEDFATEDSAKRGEFLKVKRLEITPLDYSLDPPHMKIGEMTAQDPSGRLAIENDGKINVFTVLRMDQTPIPEDAVAEPADPAGTDSEAPSAAPAPAAAKPAPSPASDTGEITIKRIRLRNGRLSYEDRSVQPAVSLALTRVSGTIAGLSSKELARADVDVEARLENVAAVKLSGKINPLIENQYTDLTLEAKGADLMPMAPYCGKYLGYEFRKGKLDLAMKYLVNSRNLQASNLITIDQLTLGEKVPSPDATGLPVKLGIALLKDRNGVIELDVPVEGNLDDPKFRLGRVIMHAIGVVFTKLVTSPFRLLARAFGGSEEDLSFLQFDPGSDALTPAVEEKLNLLVTSLYERPALSLAIHGSTEETADREGLKRKKLEDLLRREKWEEMSKKERAATPLESVTVSDSEKAALVKPVFKTAWSKGIAALVPGSAVAAPDKAEGEKPEAPEEMEDWLLARLEVSTDDLRQLAARRAAAVRDYVLATQKVEAERLFLTEEKPADAGDGCRVTLALN